MEMTGTERIEAPRDKVWAALNDVDILRQCIPGCQLLEKSSETEMTATVKLKIGIVAATFKGEVCLENISSPSGYTITGQGKGGVAGFARGSADVSLTEEGQTTLLSYNCSAQVGGKIAQMGARLIDSTAKKLASQFFSEFNRVVSDA
ncbi:MAG: carbon monoxide dehydrogenase [Hoeflea sp. BRH_c9]|nr:MAG: carbon monoxide dehydrogenase [Hoeflea sp. BRH_c9]